jgi:hypothetical protein
VAGNHDSHIPGLPEKDLVEIGDKRIGIIHGTDAFSPLASNGVCSPIRRKNGRHPLRPHHIRHATPSKRGYYSSTGRVCGRFPAMHRSYGVLT